MNSTKTLKEWQQLAREQGISTTKQGKTKMINKTIAELRSDIALSRSERSDEADSPVGRSPIEYMIYKGYKLDTIPEVEVPEKYPSKKKINKMTRKQKIICESTVYPKITKHQRRKLITYRLYHARTYSDYRWIEGLGTDDRERKEMTLEILPVHFSGRCKRYDATLIHNSKEYKYSTINKDDMLALKRYIHTNYYVRDPVKYSEPAAAPTFVNTHYYYASTIYVKDDTLTQSLYSKFDGY